MVIKDIIGREILDSRGNPTVEVDLYLEDGRMVRSSVPSGASTGEREAIELRDNDNRYLGQGVKKAVDNINKIIKKLIIGKEINQELIDNYLIKIDSTTNKSNIGANALLGISLCIMKSLALINNKPLYKELRSVKKTLPTPMMNIVNGGMHADNNLDIQEFMIVPKLSNFKESLRAGSEIFHNLKKILKNKKMITSVGDEGGFAPDLNNNIEALDLIIDAIKESGYVPGKEVYIALDVAASSFYNQETKDYTFNQEKISAKELMDFYLDIIKKYPIISIEDPFYENDFEQLTEFTKLVGNKIMVVGDDYFVTNKEYLIKGIKEKAGNAILLKANQIGTITEMFETIELAKNNNYNTIISHRSGETEDTFIADIAVGLNIPYIKTGSLSRGERIAKYNQLLRIEEEINNK